MKLTWIELLRTTGFEIPFPGLDVILRNALAVKVEAAKTELGQGVARLGGFDDPFPRLDVILCNAFAVGVEKAKPPLGLGVTLLGSFEPPFPRSDLSRARRLRSRGRLT